MTNKEKYKKAFDVLAASEKLSLEGMQMNGKKEHRNRARKLAAAAAALVVIVAAGTGVHAAMRYWGILNFMDDLAYDVPEEAVSQIQTEVETTPKKNDTAFDFTVREALRDSQTITIVYEVAAKETGQYLLVPADALPEDQMSNWSDASDLTAQEYAAEKGLTIVNVSGGIMNSEELGIDSQALDFQSVSDDVMDVFVTCGISGEGKSVDVDLVATARVAGEEEALRMEQSFTLQDLSTTTAAVYFGNAGNFAESYFAIERAEVIQTDLGTYVDVYYSDEKGIDPENGLTFRIVDESGKEYDSTGGSGVETLGGDRYKQRCMLNKCEIGDSLYIEAFDCYEKNVYGVMELSRKD